jgi:release factor glutamine methyltransferase
MQHFLSYIQSTLGPIYPTQEIKVFSRLLLKQLASLSSVQIYSDKDTKFPDEIRKELCLAVDRLAKREPIQYILGKTEFYGLEFGVRPGVLIPRPETEELVDLILKDFPKKERSEPLHLLDIGTGSGCIAVSIAKNRPEFMVSAWDISSEALAVAGKNAKKNLVEVTFRLTDILTYDPGNEEIGTLDIMVSNPPYICRSEQVEMEEQVLSHEPHLALFVKDEDPLLFYRVIAQQATRMLKKNGALYFEINSRLGEETLQLMHQFPFRESGLFQDISGKDRMIRAIL